MDALVVVERPVVLAGHEVEVAVAVEIAKRGRRKVERSRRGGDLVDERIGRARATREVGLDRAARVLEVLERVCAREEIEIAVAIDVPERGLGIANESDAGE